MSDVGATGAAGATAGRDWPLVVRRARAADRDAVLGFASRTWDGWDYIPNAWPAWLDADDGVLLVACPGNTGGSTPRAADGTPLAVDQPIAVARVALLSPTEAWLEGIRVDPRVRGLGVATDFQAAELRWAAAFGATVVRYATSQRNEASHRLGARHGLTLLRAFRNWHSHEADPPWDDDNDPEDEVASGFDANARGDADALRGRVLDALGGDGLVAAPGDGAGWWQRLAGDPTFGAGERLTEHRGWTFQRLTRELFDRHVAAGEVLVAEADGGWALAIMHRRALPSEDVDLNLAVLAGDGRPALALLDRLRRAAGRRIRFWLPDPDPPLLSGLDQDFAAAHFHGRPWTLHVLERPLDAAHPPPEPADPALLVLADEPGAARPAVG